MDVFHPVAVASTDLRRGPAGESDLRKRTAHVRPVDVTVADLAEAVRLAPILHVELDDPFAKRANPLGRLAEALVVADVEVAPHPRAVDLVEVLGQQVSGLVVVAFRVV